jgi:hypothetical protein
MTIESDIIKNIENLPQSVKQAVLLYTEFLAHQYGNSSSPETKTNKRGGLGIWKDQIWIADDFNEPLEDFADYM